MKLYLLAILLLSTLGCAKKEDAEPTTNMGSYQLDNTTLTCQATATTSTTTSGLSVDYLLVDLVTTPQPATGVETLRLYFLKPHVASNNTYTLSDITLTNKGNPQPNFFSVNAATLTPTSSGGFSGTFSGKFINSSGSTPAPYTTITNGTFTNVRP